MALTVAGFAGTEFQVTDEQWSRIHELLPGSDRGQRVGTGMAVTPGSGRAVSVAAGDALLPGLLVTNTSAVSVPLLAVATRQWVVVEADWSAQAVALKAVQSLTQTAGVRWHLPIASATVPAGVTTVTTSHIAPYRQQSSAQLATASVAARSWWATSAAAVVATVNLPDPGRPYHVVATASVEVSGASGRANGWVHVGSQWIGFSRSPFVSSSRPAPLTVPAQTTAPLSGTVAVTFTVGPQNVTQGDQISVAANDLGRLRVQQILA